VETKSTTSNATPAGWTGGWSISSPAAGLLQETLSPLRVELSETPGRILLATPKIKGELFMTDPADGALSLFANGVRMVRETDEGTRLFSFYKPQPNALVIEADDPHLDFISEGDIEQLDDGNTVVAASGQHRMVIVANWKRSPVRMAVLSGTGESAQLAARARTLLNTSAHLALDALRPSATVTPAAGGATIEPHAYLTGRMRPASTIWPGPWLAGHEEEPVFNMAIQFLLARALAADDDALPAGLAGTVLEVLSARTHDARLLAEIARLPLLLQIMQRLPAQQEHWLAAAAAHAPAIEAYLEETGKPWSYVHGSLSPLAARLRPWLARREKQAWKALADRAGVAFSSAMTPPPVPGADDPPWLLLLDEDRAAAMDATAIEEALDALTHSLEEGDDGEDTVACWSMALLIADDSILMARPALRRAFRQRLMKLAAERWRARASAMLEAGWVTYDDRDLAVAAVALWAQVNPPDDASSDGEAGRAILWRLSIRRRRLVAIAAVTTLLFVAWLVSVQFRRSLPPSAFETRIGMIQHFYQTGAYDTALEKLDELERTGALGAGTLDLWRGKVLYRMGRFAEAAEAFLGAAEELEENPSPRFNRALSQFKQQQYADAQSSFEALAGQFKTTHPATAARALRAAAISSELAASTER
jgi:tetratricopeptide (TPR) repeat protein